MTVIINIVKNVFLLKLNIKILGIYINLKLYKNKKIKNEIRFVNFNNK
jgi:hypothetical protein